VTLVRTRGARVVFDGGGSVPLPDLDVAAGEVVAVVGANGTGKSTLLRALAGATPAEGLVERPSAPGETAWVAQRPFLFRGTAAENVILALAAAGVEASAQRERALAALEAVGASALAGRPARALSEGQAMRVALARALAVRPRLLLLDEALAPLDAEGQRDAAAAVAAIAGVTVIAAAPSPESLAALRPTRSVRLGG
jgi:ABC-type nitrate/sulfonate/bicarbonate transport system ATPase subunit